MRPAHNFPLILLLAPHAQTLSLFFPLCAGRARRGPDSSGIQGMPEMKMPEMPVMPSWLGGPAEQPAATAEV